MLRLSSMLLLSIGISMWLDATMISAQDLTTDMMTSSSTSSRTYTCQSGYFKTAYGYCNWCQAGYYCPGDDNAYQCPLGTSTYWSWGQTSCSPCSTIGTYASVPGTEMCQNCPAGYFCPNTTLGPIPCPIGTHTWGNMNSIECMPCPDGMIANTEGTRSCKWCPEGFYCPNATNAIPCPKGMASRVKQYDTREYTKCVACPAGTYTPSSGAQFCTPCPDGSYCPDPNSSPILCPKGTSSMVDYNYYYYWNQGYSSSYYVSFDSYRQVIWANGVEYRYGERCYPCPTGYYANTAGQTLCTRCPEGYHCPDKTALPVACPKGFYSGYAYQWFDMYGYYDKRWLGDTCLRCPAGTFSNTTASTTCYQCPYGMICSDPANNPTFSPDGFMTYYNQYNTYDYTYGTYTTLFIPYYSRCSKGYYLQSGTNNMNYCQPCPQGSYCPDPSLPPQPCPAGLIAEGMAYSTCNMCYTGSYAKDNTCEPCPPGNYCPMSNQGPIPCPRGQYSFGSAGQCSLCPDNSYTTGEGSTGCLPCPDNCCCNDPSKDPVCSI